MKHSSRPFVYIFLLLTVFACQFLTGCATYHQKTLPFHQAISEGRFDDAVAYMDEHSSVANGRNKLLYWMEKGTALHLSGQYQLSNDAFETAYIILDEFGRDWGAETVSLISNPSVIPYAGEDFEKVQIHYFKAVNSALLGNLNDAIVECRRINIKLNTLNSRYDDTHQNHYGTDAFAWNLMGLFFDADRDYNNAFICYRNALEAYESSYVSDYNIYPPDQLKHDLLTSAWRTGLKEEFEFYQEKLNIDWKQPSANDGNIIIFWNNGLGPFKHEQSINFYLNRGDGGLITFANSEHNFFVPVPATGQNNHNLGDLSFVRMALPEYIVRTPYYGSASITIPELNKQVSLSLAQNLNEIALLNLQDRMGRELGKALLRLAIKKAIEEVVRHEDKAAGAVVSIINAISEQADTRNWQTLPYWIGYARLTLPAGSYQASFHRVTSSTGTTDSNRLTLQSIPGSTQFISFSDPYSILSP